MATAAARSAGPRCGSGGTYAEFERAVMGLVHGGCCATPSLSVSRPAMPLRDNTSFRRLGHREFDAFDQAGIPRRDSFRLATATAATALGLTTVGTVAEGGRAELIASRTDPRQSGWSVQRDLVATIARGVLMTAADLDEAIHAELGRFENKFSEFTTRLLARLNMRQVAKNFVG